ncbi:MAG TPA: ACT domain-containing protein [Pyrinomonadaceae bacterium]|nr:ACT domain-containing protein [Pyrinomonadaceae bacterium]
MASENQKAIAAELLKRARVSVAAPTFYLVGLRHAEWSRLLENPELSPRSEAVFMLLKDAHEVTLLLEEADWRTMRHAARDAVVEGGFRLLTFDIVLEWTVVGFLSHVTTLLAEAGISCGALAAFSRDHLLIKQDELAKALKVLGPHVAELC